MKLMMVFFSLIGCSLGLIVCRNCSEMGWTCQPSAPCEKGYRWVVGPCGCCVECYKVLELGERCARPFPLLGGAPLPVVCDNGLICTNGTCQNYCVSKIPIL